jgi:hypothetical protein
VSVAFDCAVNGVITFCKAAITVTSSLASKQNV